MNHFNRQHPIPQPRPAYRTTILEQHINAQAPIVPGSIAGSSRPSISESVVSAQNIPLDISNAIQSSAIVIPPGDLITAPIPRAELYLLTLEARYDSEQYDRAFEGAESWLLHLAVNSAGNTPNLNLSIFFSTLCLYMPTIRRELKDYADRRRLYGIVELELGRFLTMFGITLEAGVYPDPDFNCDVDNNKGILNLGLQCLLIGKSLHENNHVNWFTRRFNSVGGTLGVRETIYREMMAFPLEYCKDLYACMSTNKDLRSKIFRVMLRITKENIPLKTVMAAICNLLSGCELTSFLLVYRHLLVENPVLFYLSDLIGLPPDLQAALAVFRVYKDDRMYIKLLGEERHCKIFNTPAIATLAKVAKAVAMDTGDSTIRNYQTTPSSEGEERLRNQAVAFRRLTSLMVTKESNALRRSHLADTEKNTNLVAMSYATNFDNIMASINQVDAALPVFAGGNQAENVDQ